MGIKGILKRTPLYPYYFARTHTIPADLSGQDYKIARIYSQFVGAGSLVFDVGANIGFRTKIFRHLGCRVVAIEPQRNCVAALKRTFGKEITIVHAGASDREGYAELQTSEVTAISSLSSEWIGAMKGAGHFLDVGWSGKERVRLVPLDSLIAQYGPPDFIKIDVEGHELAVLRGLSTAPPALSFEIHPEFRENAVACIDRLSWLGEYQFNYSHAETGEMRFPEWLDKDGLMTSLEAITNYGDIYARRVA